MREERGTAEILVTGSYSGMRAPTCEGTLKKQCNGVAVDRAGAAWL